MRVTDENDRPFGPFESAGSKRFKNASIEAVIVEVRYSAGRAELTDVDAVTMLEEFARYGAIRMEPSQQNQIQFMINPSAGVAESTQSVVARGWQFSNDDRSCVFNVTSQAASVQLSHYERWSVSLLPRLSTLLDVVNTVCAARVIERTGIRYINRFPALSDGGPWTDVVAISAAGPLSDPILGALVTSAQQQFELLLEPGIGAVVRHGPLPGTGFGYLMDIDVYDIAARELIPETVLGRIQRLNRTAFALFCQLISSMQLEEMESMEDAITGGSA